jgi:hypothetical protein
MSTNAYRSVTDAQFEYDAWFGNGTAVIQTDTVTQWRADNNHVLSPVQFQLVTFPNKGNFALVNVRGTYCYFFILYFIFLHVMFTFILSITFYYHFPPIFSLTYRNYQCL